MLVRSLLAKSGPGGGSAGFSKRVTMSLRASSSRPSTASEIRCPKSSPSAAVLSVVNWFRSTGTPVKSVGKWYFAS